MFGRIAGSRQNRTSAGRTRSFRDWGYMCPFIVSSWKPNRNMPSQNGNDVYNSGASTHSTDFPDTQSRSLKPQFQHVGFPLPLKPRHVLPPQNLLQRLVARRVFFSIRVEAAIILLQQALLLQVVAEVSRLGIVRPAVLLVKLSPGSFFLRSPTCRSY